MLHRFVSGNASKGETAEFLGNLHAAGSLINTQRFINVRLATVVSAVTGQVVSDPHEHTPQSTVCLTDDRSAVIVRVIALMT